jgi:hypothetical protein
MKETQRTTSELWLVASMGATGRLPSDSAFAVWGDLPPREIMEFGKAGLEPWPLPELATDEAEDLLARYHRIIASIGLENGSASVWWYTWCSSRDRFHSRILADMELIARLQKACLAGMPHRLVMLCADPHLAGACVVVAGQQHVSVRIPLADRLLWMGRRVRRQIGPLFGVIKTCARAIIIKHRVRKIRTSLARAKAAGARTILTTWIKSANLRATDPVTDTYFGRLPDLLVNEDRSVVIFGDLLDGIPASQPETHADPPTPVLTMASLLTYWDIFSAAARGSFSRIKTSESLQSEPPYLASLVGKDIHFNRDSVVFGVLLENALLRLVKELQPTQIIHMCENNPWERACSRVAGSIFPKPEVVGYMHCAVILAHTKIIMTERESLVRPRPSKLICTGPQARDIMVRFGGHPPSEVVAGSALRHEYLASIRPRTSLNRPIRNILVVLEGLPSMSHLVRFVYDALDGQDRFRTVIRPHPAYRLDLILDEAGLGVSDFQTIRISENSHIMQDFDDADLVVYKGSTAAIEAGYMGIPLIHFKHQNLLTDDPLFEITDLKQVACVPGDLIRAIEGISQLDDQEFRRQLDSLRAYIKGYLTVPGEDCASVFLPEPTAVPAID